ncbi:MAG: murein biosynthesis integral membrane protein MurJ [Rhodobacteraceae bacterium]|nr:murein biosynthesis integral membrane protein MurJ [Paracoccaceae bacterium]
MRKIRLVSGFFTVGIWTLASKILGFVRDIMIAGTMGSGPMAQAFLIAFSLPNMFRRFFAEGAFNTAFVPMFSKKVESGEGAQDFASEALSGLASIVLVTVLLGQVFMPFLVLAMASGFADDARFALTVNYGRIVFPYILFISLAALLSGVLNALGRFAAAAAAPVLLNIILVAAMYLAAVMGWEIGVALSWGVLLAGVAQMALVWWAAKQAGITLLPRRPRLSPEMKRLAIIAFPAALAGGVVQVNLLVGRQVASYFDGAVAWLSYADRLYQLPLGVVGIAIGVVLLPDLSRKLRAGDDAGGNYSLNRAAEFSFALTLPAAVALVVIPLPLVSVLFERGAFSATDSANTALAVAIYGAGLPSFVLAKVLAPLFFAREDTKTPFRFALVSMVVNAALAIGLAPYIGFLAAAIGTTVAGWSMLLLLWIGSRRLGAAAAVDARLKSKAPKIIFSSIIMGATLLAAAYLLGPWLSGGALRYLALAGLVLVGALSYGGAAMATGALRISELKAMLRR